MTVAEIARAIWEESDEDPAAFELVHVGSFEVDVPRRWPDGSKAEQQLGWTAQVPVREGIRRTVEWLREQGGARGSAPPVAAAWSRGEASRAASHRMEASTSWSA